MIVVDVELSEVIKRPLAFASYRARSYGVSAVPACRSDFHQRCCGLELESKYKGKGAATLGWHRTISARMIGRLNLCHSDVFNCVARVASGTI